MVAFAVLSQAIHICFIIFNIEDVCYKQSINATKMFLNSSDVNLQLVGKLKLLVNIYLISSSKTSVLFLFFLLSVS